MLPARLRFSPMRVLLGVAVFALAGCAALDRRLELERLATVVEAGKPLLLLGLEQPAGMTYLTRPRTRRFGDDDTLWPPERPSLLFPHSPPSPTPPAAEAGFTAHGRRWLVSPVEPGRYRLSVGLAHMTPGGGRYPDIGVPLHWNSVVLEVPPDAGVIYAGTQRVRCAPGASGFLGDAECELPAELASEQDLAAAVAAEHLARAGRFAAVEPLPSLPATGVLGVPPPRGVADITAESRSWRRSVDWVEFGGDAVSQATFRRARGTLDAAAEIGSSSQIGALLSLPLLAGAAVTAGVAASQRGTEQRVQAELEHTFSACAARVSEALGPETIGPRLRAALPVEATPPPPPASSRRRATPATPTTEWRVALSRLVLRRCGGAEISYGVDVASRWTAWPPGAAEPAYDATLLVPVAEGIDDTRREDRRPRPWETVLPLALPCRPFTAYCGPGGEALLTQDVLDAVLAAREAIEAAR